MNPNATVATLHAARKLYADAPSHAGVYATPPLGTHCITTATMRASLDLNEPWSDATAADDALRSVLGLPLEPSDALMRFNAENSTETVLAAFDAAIAQAGNLDPSSPAAETVRRDIGGTTC